MPATVNSLEAQALQLPPEERTELIERLLASVAPASLSPEWQAEVERRMAKLNSGQAQPIGADDVFARIDARLRRAGA